MRLKRFMQARGFKKWDTWRTFQNRRRRRGLLFRFRIGGGCILCCCTCCRIFVHRLCSDAFVGRFRIRRGICGSILRRPILVLGQRQTWRRLRWGVGTWLLLLSLCLERLGRGGRRGSCGMRGPRFGLVRGSCRGCCRGGRFLRGRGALPWIALLLFLRGWGSRSFLRWILGLGGRRMRRGGLCGAFSFLFGRLRTLV